MDYNSTSFLTFSEISTAECDLLEDAYGISSEFSDVFEALGEFDISPREEMLNSLFTELQKTEHEKTTGL